MAVRHPSIAAKAAKAAKAARVAKAKRHATEGKNTVVTAPSKAYTDPRDVLLKPVVSEKSYALLDENKYTFIVDPNANKTQIKQAVQSVFSVKVTGVNTINRQGKRKRTRTGFGQRAATKRAIVTLAEATVSTSSAVRPRKRVGSSDIGRGLRNGNPQVQADYAGPPWLQRRRLRRGHAVHAGEVAGPSPAQQGRP